MTRGTLVGAAAGRNQENPEPAIGEITARAFSAELEGRDGLFRDLAACLPLRRGNNSREAHVRPAVTAEAPAGFTTTTTYKGN